MFEEDQQTEALINRNEEPPEKNVRRSTRARSQSTRLTGFERFSDQAVDADGDLIEESMMIVEADPVNLDQAMNDFSWLATMKEELREIEKNKTWELVENSINKPIDVK